MHESTWEDSASAFRYTKNDDIVVAQTILISEIEMRWNEARIGNLELLPLKIQRKSVIGKNEYIHESPYSRLLILRGCKEGDSDYPFGLNIGQALSSLMSFVMRCSVISHNEWFPAFHHGADKPQGMEDISGPAVFWIKYWEKVLGLEPGATIVKGLRQYLHGYIPSPEEEQSLMETMGRVCETVMKTDEETYYSVIGAMRLYQLAFNVARVDFSLAYSLLVAAIDAVASGLKLKVKLKDVDPEKKLTKLMEELEFDKKLQEVMNNLVVHHKSLTERFSSFIAENLPVTFWEGDYSMIREMDLFSESLDKHYRSGQFLRDISASAPEPKRLELSRLAEIEERRYKDFLTERPDRKRLTQAAYGEDRRNWMMAYLRTHLDRVLRNTFESRSELLHSGRGFPKIGLKEEYIDWIPEVFEEDYREFIDDHLEHRWGYSLDEKGRISRNCSCGDTKEVKILLGIHVFERMVHDSILNYLLKMNTT